MKFRRFVALLLCLCLVFGSVPAYADEASGASEPVDGTAAAPTIQTLQLDGATLMTPGFSEDCTNVVALVDGGVASVGVTMTVSPGASVDGAVADKADPTKYTDTVTMSGSSVTRVYQPMIAGTDGEEAVLGTALTLKLMQVNNSVSGMPDAVVDYLAPGSQHTNGNLPNTWDSEYALYPERSLLGSNVWPDEVSLGNFGGHIVWYYEDAITDDPSHPYGVDFRIFGNSYNIDYGEAGQVWVSEDGKTWYALAGSEHYEDSTIWDYQLTYSDTGSPDIFSWWDNKGNYGTWSNETNGAAYPAPKLYPLHDFGTYTASQTLSGVLLKSYTGDVIDAEAPSCYYNNAEMFGYVDTLPSLTSATSDDNGVTWHADFIYENPYALSGNGSGFDLAWAVDANGMPVKLDGVHYIKVQSASFADLGTNGEASTEVYTCLREGSADTVLDVTAAPASIVISQSSSDDTVELKPGDFTRVSDTVYTIDRNVGDMSSLLFTVNSADGDNIYVNNQPVESGETTGRAYAVELNNDRVVRIIVQNGDKQPVCYFLNLSSDVRVSETVRAVEELIAAIGTVTAQSEAKIEAAREAYDALSSDEKAMVRNYDVLTKAEEKLHSLDMEGVGTSTNALDVTISVEKFVLGQGYIVEPTLVRVPEDTQIAQIIVALLGIENVNFKSSTGSSNFYLAYIADNERTPDVPEEILNKLGSEYTGERTNPDWLGDFDYTMYASWMYSVNNEFPQVMASDYELEKNDVIRWQFSMYGWGADIGQDNTSWGGDYIPLADKTELTELVARANALTESSDFKRDHDAYDDAMDVLEEWGASQSEVDEAYYALKAAMSSGNYGRVVPLDLVPEEDQDNQTSVESTREEIVVEEDAASVVLTPQATAKGGSATVTLAARDITDAIKEAEDNDADNITIAPDITGEADKVTVELTKAMVKELAEADGLSVTVQNPQAGVTVPAAGLADLAGQSGKTITVTTEALADGDGEATGEVRVEVAVDGQRVDRLTGGIIVAVPADGAVNSNVLVSVADDGTQTIIKKSAVGEDCLIALLYGSAVVKVVDNSKVFADVAGHWGKDSISFVTSREIFQGTEKGFEPNAPVDRAMLVTALFRLEGAIADGKHGFADVPADAWYADAVAWTSANGIIQGTENGFEPMAKITREQLAAMLYRYAGHIGMDTAVKGKLSDFNDRSKIADWAQEPLEWAVGTGLMSGKPGELLDPSGSATRAEVATIMTRFISNMVQ